MANHLRRISLLVIFLFSLVLLVTSVNAGTVYGNNSIYQFNVTDCSSDTGFVDCNSSVIRFNCSISNYNFISDVRFMIEGVLYDASRLNSYFWYDYNKQQDFYSSVNPVDFTRVYITDTSAYTVIDFENVSVLHSCEMCSTNYTVIVGECLINNTREDIYIGHNNCSTNHTEIEICDYCFPEYDIEYTECIDSMRNVSYTLNNQYSCCDVTGFPSDCYVPENSTESCSFYNNSMDCDIDANPYLDNKWNWLCYIPMDYSNESFSCNSFLMFNESIIQTNPKYEMRTSTVFNPKSEIEDREYFVPDNGLVNVYFRSEGIASGTTFVGGVVCKSVNRELKFRADITPVIGALRTVPSVGVWANQNMYIIVGIVIILGFIIWLLFNWWSMSKG